MAKKAEGQERQTWWRRQDASVQAAIIAVVGTVFGALLGSGIAYYAALHQQDRSFKQQRALADRAELRDVLDAAAVKLEEAMSASDRMFVTWDEQWRLKSRHVADIKPFRRAEARAYVVALRITLRLSGHSEIYRRYHAALIDADDAAVMMVSSPPREDVRNKVSRLRYYAKLDQNAFSDNVLHLLKVS